MRPSLFQAQIHPALARCDVCRWRCELAPDEIGRCGVRRHAGGSVQVEADGLLSAATITPIEDHRLWHFFPDAQVFSVGSYGTPLTTLRDGQFAAIPPDPAQRRSLAPERVADFAQQRLCRGIVWTFNDPAVTLEWTLDGLKLAQATSRFTAVVSCGYFSPEAIEVLGPYLDALRLDLLGFSDYAYAKLGGLDRWRGILAGAERLRATWNTHIEVALALHTGINDDERQIKRLSEWICEKLGSLTPLHLTTGSGDANADAAANVARASGLVFVYGPNPHQATRCPQCRWIVIERSAGPTKLPGVADDMCDHCRTPLGLRTSIWRKQTRYAL